MIWLVIPAVLFAAEMAVRVRIKKKRKEIAHKAAQVKKDIETKKSRQKFVRIVPVRNSGFAGSRLTDKPKVVKAASAISLAVYAVLYPFFILSGESALMKCGMSLILGGAAGNTCERLKDGYVTDYIQFVRKNKKGAVKKSLIWNLADFAILFGTVLTVIGALKKK